MELVAVIEGLKKIEKLQIERLKDSEAQVKIYTDSSYVINGITKWIHGWKRNGWKTKIRKDGVFNDVLNKDLWMDLDEALNEIGPRNVSWEYVGGHVGIVGNERCDHIATDFADGMKVKLYKGPLANYDLPKILNVSHDSAKIKAKKSSSSRSKTPAYSYVSLVGGKIEIHHTWVECEKRVKGAKGARYKKSTDAMNEIEIVNEFSKHFLNQTSTIDH